MNFFVGWFLPTSNIGSSYWSLKHLGDSHVLHDPNNRKNQAKINCVNILGFCCLGTHHTARSCFCCLGFPLIPRFLPPPLKTMDYHGWSPEWLNTFASSDIWSANCYGTVIWMIGSTQWVDGPFFCWKDRENDMMLGIFGWCTQQYPCI